MSNSIDYSLIHDKDAVAELRQSLARLMSPKRLKHTLAVERMSIRLCDLYCPELTDYLRVASLLHDVTKEWPLERHVAYCDEHGIERTRGDVLAPKCFHAKTAASLIVNAYPQFAHPIVVSAVRWHTTGHADMTVSEKVLYLADYIDDSRVFPDCVTLRSLFWDANPAQMTQRERDDHLRTVLITSFDMTCANLIQEGVPISPDTVTVRNQLLYEQSGM